MAVAVSGGEIRRAETLVSKGLQRGVPLVLNWVTISYPTLKPSVSDSLALSFSIEHIPRSFAKEKSHSEEWR
jgi:hypothetical protein